MNGYIKIHRKLTEWGWYDDPFTKAVFLHLLLTANWKESTYHGVKLNPGDTVIGRKKLAEELGMSEQNVRTALKKLEQTGEITKKSTNRFTVVTIENWALYQFDDKTLTNNQPTTNQQLTNNQPTTNHTLRKKEYKEVNNYKNTINVDGEELDKDELIKTHLNKHRI